MRTDRQTSAVHSDHSKLYWLQLLIKQATVRVIKNMVRTRVACGEGERRGINKVFMGKY